MANKLVFYHKDVLGSINYKGVANRQKYLHKERHIPFLLLCILFCSEQTWNYYVEANIGRDIYRKKGISHFTFCAFYVAQNTNTSDIMRSVRPTSLCFITWGKRQRYWYKERHIAFYFFAFYFAQNTPTNRPIRPIRPTSLSFIVKG